MPTHFPRKAIPTGMMSGAMGQFLASPTDLVKIRLQMEGKRALDGLKPRQGPAHTLHREHWEGMCHTLSGGGQ